MELSELKELNLMELRDLRHLYVRLGEERGEESELRSPHTGPITIAAIVKQVDKEIERRQVNLSPLPTALQF